MADSSFDIVSKLDRQEVDNALSQAAREIANRFDFKGTGASIEWKGEKAIERPAAPVLVRITSPVLRGRAQARARRGRGG